ncbi:MAG TPA: o-succinylbenzoate synthase [Thermoprotei archaeon]|nr:o-succinylbenzoate synthase [Thermoprotei archaeon]
MEIESIELYHIRMKLAHPFETSFGRQVYRSCILVKVEDESGVEGWAECVAGRGPWYSYETVETAWHIIRDFIAPLVFKEKQVNPLTVNRVLSKIRGHNMAKASVEMAIWDAEAKIRKQPLSVILGGEKEKIESGVSIGIQKDIDYLLKRISMFLDQGYRRIKLKIKPGWDVEVVKRVRKEYPDIRIQVDANAAYTLRDLRVLLELDKLDLLMIEQPLGYDDLIYHSKLQSMLKTPLCLDESIKSPEDAVKANLLGSCRIINIKPGRVGGHRASLMIHDYCTLAGLGVWIGGMLETGIGRGHLVALASLPGINYPNDISASDRYYEEDIVEPPWTLNPDGTISVPNKPGIGIKVKTDLVEELALKKTVLRKSDYT